MIVGEVFKCCELIYFLWSDVDVLIEVVGGVSVVCYDDVNWDIFGLKNVL